MAKISRTWLTLGFSLWLWFANTPMGLGFSANQVFYEKRANGRVRVIVSYTIPSLREYREAFVEFNSEREAGDAYWNLVRGADFFIKNAQTIAFSKPQLKPEPW